MTRLLLFLSAIVAATAGMVQAEIVPDVELMPLYASSAHSQQTPFAIFLRVTGLTEGKGYEFVAKLRQGDGDYGSFTTAEAGSFDTSYKLLGVGGSDGTLTKWVFLRPSKLNPAPGPCQIRIRVREVGEETTPTPVDFPGPTLLDMSGTGDGAWLTGGEEGNPPDGCVVLAYDASGGLLGAYAAENNGLNEGNDPVSGRWKIALPANTSIGRMEARKADNSLYATDSSPDWRTGAPGSTTMLTDICLYLGGCHLIRWAELKMLFK